MSRHPPDVRQATDVEVSQTANTRDTTAADAAAAAEVRGAGVRGGGARARAEGARGYFGIFAKLLGDHNNGGDDNGEEEEEEVWVAYRAARGELPQEEGGFERFEGYNGFVVTGSCNDAHDDDPWIRDLVRFLQMLIARRKKVLGICFGHQCCYCPTAGEGKQT
uniref:Glutamine amidotransferase domain-containing protein n=1 Tax=Ananas comosus var. bracteatus TaxID=296719 RepID=A0A6V7PMI1_ANACO|nr:unnamed protein product [Ananas comosus var. bracteatus]